ncbi:hypothetical protein QRE66_12855 [Bacillus cereus]|nr:hypothetical protein QRE66_12855 [Bacillus cereus]
MQFRTKLCVSVHYSEYHIFSEQSSDEMVMGIDCGELYCAKCSDI